MVSPFFRQSIGFQITKVATSYKIIYQLTHNKAMNYTYVKKISIASVFSLVLASFLAIPSAQAATTADLQAQIQSLLQQINHLKELKVMQNGQSTGSCSLSFSRNLTVGSMGPDVMALQKFLNRDEETKVALYSYGSPGLETSYYGARTHEAVQKFQNKYRSAQVMSNGNVDSGTRVQLEALCKNINGDTGTPTQTLGATSVTRGSEHDSTIEEGDTGIVYAVDIKAGDLKQTVETIDFDFSKDPARYIDSFTLYQNNNQIKSVDANTATEVSGQYRMMIKNLDKSIARNTTETFSLRAKVNNSLSNTYQNDNLTVLVPKDGVHLLNSNNTRTNLPKSDLSSRSFDFKSAGNSNSNSNSGDGELKVTEATNSPDDTDVEVSKNNPTNNVTVIESEIEAQNSRISLSDIYVTIESDHSDIKEVVRSLSVKKGSATIDTKDVTKNGNSPITITDSNGDKQTLVDADEYYVRFTNLNDLKINEDDTETITIKADFEKQSNSTYDDNTDVTFTLRAIEGRDDKNNRIVASDLDVGSGATFTLKVN